MSEPMRVVEAPPWDDELEFIPGTFARTDLGNAERLVARFRGNIHWSGERKKWLIWNGRRWEWDETLEIERKAKATARGIYQEAARAKSDEDRKYLAKWAVSTEGRGSISAMVAMARAEQGVPILVDSLDQCDGLLNCENGTLDLDSGELLPHRREDLITRTTGIRYIPGAGSELWDRVLWNMTGGDRDLQEYLQRVSGYALYGKAIERKFWFAFGPPGTGKSTLLDALMAAMGDYAIATNFDTWTQQTNIGGNRPDLVALQGRRLITASEPKKGVRWDTGLIKAVTGGDMISASAKFENTVQFRVAGKLVLVGNFSPRVSEDDDGFWVRMNRIPFNSVVPLEQQVKDLKENLRKPEHAEAVLAWAVQGFKKWRVSGIGDCPAVRNSTEVYRATSDDFLEFLDEFYIREEGARVLVSAFRATYVAWVKREGLKFQMRTSDLRERMEREGLRWLTVRGKRMIAGLRMRDDVERAGPDLDSFLDGLSD